MKLKPFYDYTKDGITQSLLGTFQSCRQKALYNLEGWTQPHTSAGLTYGTIIHAILEVIYGMIKDRTLNKLPDAKLIKLLAKKTEKQWYIENPKPTKYSLENLQMSLLIAEATLPVYFEYWFKEDFKTLKWQSLEQQFKIPYTTKDGRKTFIRGKKDGVFGGNPSYRLFETKTKSMFNEEDLVDTLWFERQVNLYLWAMRKIYGKVPSGVLYNIIRRTNLRLKEAETLPAFSKRVAADISERPDFYFVRMEVKVGLNEMLSFEKQLEAMVVDFMNWWDNRTTQTYKNTDMCNDKYGRCQFLTACSTGSMAQYAKRKQVFNELESF